MSKKRKKFGAIIKSQFLTGLFILLPLGLSLYVAWVLFNIIAGSFVPILKEVNIFKEIHPLFLKIISFFITLVIIWVIGLFARNYVGRKILKLTESILLKAPILNRIYDSIRQIIHTIMMSKKAFRKVVAIEYPRKGLYTLAFVTNYIKKKDTNEELVTLFIPTTPNPTSGWFIIVKEDETIPLNISVNEGMKMIVSGGIVYPHKFNLDKRRM